MKIQENNIIGELVARDYRAASVFKKYGIDFCCQGNRTIQDACEAKNIDASTVIADLNEANKASTASFIDYQSWPLDLLVDYIEKKHHRYVENKVLEIIPFLNKVAKVHGNHHPELLEVEKLFHESAGELAAHMKKEELILFPFIRKMVNAKINKQKISQPMFGTIRNPISMMNHEHDTEGERFRKIAELTQNYTPPADACNTYRVTYSLLKEFEEDLHLHIHLENNILFSKAIELEQELKKQSEVCSFGEK